MLRPQEEVLRELEEDMKGEKETDRTEFRPVSQLRTELEKADAADLEEKILAKVVKQAYRCRDIILEYQPGLPKLQHVEGCSPLTTLLRWTKEAGGHEFPYRSYQTRRLLQRPAAGLAAESLEG